MTLVRDAGNPMLWTNDGWRPGEPGTFAVVIGVSKYRHLDGSDQSFGLGSLFCSALTAHYVFEWLENHYRGPERTPASPQPLAQVWYLVAPTEAEVDVEPALGRGPVEPTRDSCENAIASWDARLRALSADHAARSTSIFFFSGHGFEVHSQEQLLLPSDYLSPPARNVNKGISTHHLHEGMSDLQLNEQLFFIDACRNDVNALRARNPRGETILNQPGAYSANPNRVAALFHATSSGQQAFQPLDPTEGPSLFGKALLEGLQGRPNIQLMEEGDECTVNLLALNKFLKRRVPELLAERSANVAQPVWLRMDNVDDFPISVVPRRQAAAVVRGGGRVRRHVAAAGVRPMADLTRERLSRHVSLSAGGQPSVPALWRRARIYDFESKAWTDASTAARLERATEDPYGEVMRIEFRPNSPRRLWLRLESAASCFAFLLPGDRQESPTYRLELVLARGTSAEDREIRQALLDLASEGMDGLRHAASLWEAFRDQDLSTAASALDLNLLEELLRDKLASPLGASVAGMVLLRTGSLWRMHDWARNLSNFFPDWPEGPVLWAKQLDQQQGEVRRYRRSKGDFTVEGREDPLRWLATLDERGLPSLSELVAVAAEVAARHGDRAGELEAAERERLIRVRERLDRALRHFRPGGLFSAFHAADPETLDPNLVGPWAAGT